MKKILPFLLVVLILPAMISSCKKDKNEAPQAEAEKWYFEKIVYEEFDASGALVDAETDADWTASDYLLLQNDGKFELVQAGDRIAGTYKIQGSALSLTYQEGSGTSASVTVTINAIIVEKSSTQFTFYVEESDATGKLKSTIYLNK